MIRTLVVDDEPLARENVILRLAAEQDFEICGQADNGHDAKLLAQALEPDVIFLDIQMPGLNGLAAAEEISRYSSAALVFVTAYDEHALDAFRVRALDYMIKPIDDGRFAETVKRIRAQVSLKQRAAKVTAPRQETGYLKRLGIKDGKVISMIDVSTIECIESAGDYVCVQSGGKSYIQRQTLTSLLKLLDPNDFLRIHRSHVVGLKYLQNLFEDENGLQAKLSSGRSLGVSRRFQKRVKDHVASLSRRTDQATN